MSGRAFLDTNILLYAFDITSPKKQGIAKDLLHNNPAISTQVLSEFSNVSIKKKLFAPADLVTMFRSILRITTLHLIEPETIEHALKITSKWRFSYYDSLIVASALEAGAEILYSEDMQHLQNIESLTIINPFI